MGHEFQQHSYASTSKQAVAGAARIDLGPPAAGMYWLIDRVTVVGGTGSNASLYRGEPTDGNLVDYAASADRNVADLASPIYMPPSITFVVVFAALPANQVATVTIQYRVYKLGGEGKVKTQVPALYQRQKEFVDYYVDEVEDESDVKKALT